MAIDACVKSRNFPCRECGGDFYTRINTIFSRFSTFFFGLFCFIPEGLPAVYS
jgi:hypothetical protein